MTAKTIKTILTVVGARPQFVKAASITSALAGQSGLREVMVHTGQHYDQEMSAVFFSDLAIPEPSYNLGIHGGDHANMTGRMLVALEPVMMRERPDAALVYGDTNSTLAAALTAAKLGIPIFHVEAGLRSYRRDMPEEINRVVTDHLSTLLFCPTSVSVENLAKEGIRNGVHHVGDVMYDAILRIRAKVRQRPGIEGLPDGSFSVLTLHRAENTDNQERLIELLRYVESNAEGRIVFPIHPRTRAALARSKYPAASFELIEPLGYLDMQRLLIGAREIYTDSGGLQKEAYFHRIPCITLRDETEWTETVAAGWNRLWSVPRFEPRQDIEDYGTGDAAGRIVQAVERQLAAR